MARAACQALGSLAESPGEAQSPWAATVSRTKAAAPRRSRAVSVLRRPAISNSTSDSASDRDGGGPACDSPVPRRERFAGRPEPIPTSRVAQFEPAQRIGDVDGVDRDLPGNALRGGVHGPSEALPAERRSQ